MRASRPRLAATRPYARAHTLLARSLLEHGHNAVALYGGIHPKRRKQVWQEFAGGGGAEIMVCTNLASRGLDFNNVHHVPRAHPRGPVAGRGREEELRGV